MSDATPLSLPPDLPFPIRITSIDAPSSSQVQRGTRLLSYSFVYLTPSTNIPESRFGTWDSELEGSIHKWNMSAGDVISQRKAADRPAVLILEPCTHNIQIGGLCAICGKDMTMCVAAVLELRLY
jgi:RNA polymerase II subunit A C-terminal domain phosphatase